MRKLARMALQIGWQKKITEPLAAAALKENPTDPGVRALSARIAGSFGGREDIEDLVRALEKGGTNDASAAHRRCSHPAVAVAIKTCRGQDHCHSQ